MRRMSLRHLLGTRLSQIAAIAFALAAAITDVATAGPVGANPVTPGVTITQNGNVWTIVAPNGSIINYTAFDILSGEVVNFLQGGTGARALNRVSGDLGASMIFGTLTADGTIYFVNPAGVFFGNGAVVDVAGLYAAAGNITDTDFAAHVDLFTGLAGDVTVAPQAQLAGTSVHLLGARVANHGYIEAQGGVLTMIAGGCVHLQQLGERIRVVVDGVPLNDPGLPAAGGAAPSMAEPPGVENTGTVRNTGGQTVLGAGDLYSLAFRNTGSIETPGGDVTIAASGGLVQNDGSITGGAVTIEGPSILHRGSITAAGEAALAAHDHVLITGAATITGGDVRIESPDGFVAIASGAEIDATTGGAGGSVLIDAARLTLNGTVLADAFQLRGPFNLIFRPQGGDESFLDGSAIDFTALSTDAFRNSYVSFAALEAMTGSAAFDARGSIFVGETLDLALALEFAHANDLTFDADGLISVRARIEGAGDLTLRADRNGDGFGWIELVRAIDILGDATFEATHILVRAPSVSAAGLQNWTGRTWLLADTSVAGSPVTFHGPVNSLPGLPAHYALDLPRDVVFEGTVGGVRALRSIDVHGTTLLSGGFVRTVEDQRYRGAATLGADASLASIENGTIRFDDEVDGPFRLGVATGGLTSFARAVGSHAALLSLSTDDGGTTRLAGDVHAARIVFADHVQLAGDVTLATSEYAMLRSTINGRGFDLTVESPWTLFGDDASGFGLLRTDADGVTKLEASRITGDRIELLDRVILGPSSHGAFVSGTTGVEFGSTVDGAFDLHVRSAQGITRFGGDIGAGTPLASLRIEAGAPNDLGSNLVIFEGSRVRATGDITLDPAGRSAPSTVATIAGLGDLTIESLAGDVFVGRNEKITALGSLDILASAGTATLGDLNAAGDITVDASAIDVWARNAGQVLGADGVLRNDTGTDVVAGGGIFFSAAPGTRANGEAPIYSSAIGSFSATLGGAILRLTPVSESDLTFGSLVLDLAALLDVNNLAEAINDPEAPVRDRLLREPFILEAMERLAIYLRAMSDGEIRAGTSGRQLFEDLPPTGVGADAPLRTVANRVRRESVVTVLDRYAGVFLHERANLEGEMVIEDRSELVRRALESAWRGYTRAQGASADPAGLESWLTENEGHEEAVAYLGGLTQLAASIRSSGLTPRESRRSLDAILRPISSGRFPQTSLELAIGVDEG